MYKSYVLNPIEFRFAQRTGRDKFRGLQEFGPFKQPALKQAPVFGFVFPKESRELANKLYASLKNGIGYFRGMPTAFRVPLSTQQVFQVSDFHIPDDATPREWARRYADAIVNWSAKSGTAPDLFFVIHPRTADWLDATPYYECKALLLEQGLLSQHVTSDLIQASSQFEWSVANIALAAFVKLGGIPWLVNDENADRHLLLGVGHSSLYDPEDRQVLRHIGFTACFTAAGAFRFLSLARVANTRQQYLQLLEDVVATSLEKACDSQGVPPNQVTLHIPKDVGWEERDAVKSGLSKAKGVPADLRIRIVRVNESPGLFAIDPNEPDGVPNRGTVVRVGDNEFIVCTEGREERQVWRQRTPACVRLILQDEGLAPDEIDRLVEEAYVASQVNWRTFNASSLPITTTYGALIAKVLSHVPAKTVGDLYSSRAKAILENRMWFL